MAIKKRKKRNTSLSTSVRKYGTAKKVTRRRKKRGGLLSAGGGTTGLLMSVKKNGIGALGGALFLLTKLVPMSNWVRTGVGFGGSVIASMYVNPFIGAGIAGATTYQLGQNLFPALNLNDGELEETNFVDEDTLSDTGRIDENGNAIVVDDNGNAFALNENNELEELSNSDMQNVSMLPLMDAYSLQNAFSLNDHY